MDIESSQKKRQKKSTLADHDAGEGSSSSLHWGQDEIDRKAKDIIRYVLACQFKNQTVRRDEINKRASIDRRPRLFTAVFSKTVEKLDHLFGFELAELPTKDIPHTATTPQSRRAEPSKKTSTTRYYILRNKLPESYDVSQVVKRFDEEYMDIGILYVILALIFVSEQALSDTELGEHLDRLRVCQESKSFGDRERLLDGFVRQGYLLRQNMGNSQDSRPAMVYYWGPRAKTEIPEENLVEFISNLYGMQGDTLDHLREHIYKSAGYEVS